MLGRWVCKGVTGGEAMSGVAMQPRFVLIGAGNVGLPLVAMLSRDINLLCIDLSEESLAQVRQQRGSSGVVTIRGDATSRLVLEEAGIGEADTVVIATTSERVNVEVARLIAAHFRVQRVIALGITHKGIAELEKYGAEVESIFAVSATGLRNRLELKTKTVHGIGVGKNEILEVEVHPHSRLTNKPLASLRPRRWRVGLIYREGNIIVPSGETTLKPRDRVIILGDPQALVTIAEILSFRFEAFPLEYGDTFVIFLRGQEGEAYLEEAGYLLKTFPLTRTLIIHTPAAASLAERLRSATDDGGMTVERFESVLAPSEAFATSLKRFSCRPGLAMLPHPGAIGSFFSFVSERAEKHLLLDLVREAGCPLLLARGTFPYSRTAVPGVSDSTLQHTLESALEISSTLAFTVTALFPTLLSYIATEEEVREFERMKKTVPDLGLLYKQNIATRMVAGNPIHALAAALKEHDLLVASTAEWQLSGFFRRVFRPDVGWHLVRRSPVSTLLIPGTETAI